MNKFTIPTILLATVMVAGMFAFMPVEQANTVHTTLVADISGASATVSSDTIADTFNGADSEFHWVVISSTVPFTIMDIEVRSTIDADLPDALDRVLLENVVAFPAEYDTTIADITLAITTDGRFESVCGSCGFIVIDGNDDKNTLTGSYSGEQKDNDTAFTKTYGSNMKILVEVRHTENDADEGDISSVVTFYLSGPQASDVTITTFLDQLDIV